MSKLGSFARHLLERAGYLTLRPPHGVSDGIPAFLRRLQRETKAPLQVTCVDDDTGIQSLLLSTLGSDEIRFCSPLELHRATLIPPASAERTEILFLGLFPVMPASTVADALLERKWAAILLRAQLGSFWRGEVDIAVWNERLHRLGFELEDVVATPSLSPIQMPANSILLVARPQGHLRKSSPPAVRQARVVEATTFLSLPAIRADSAQILTGRGSFGFQAGVFNPGAILEQDCIQILARGEATFWRQQKADEPTFFHAVQPCSLSWDRANGLSPARLCTWSKAPVLPSWRAEDFRLFRYRGEVFANHSLMSSTGAVPGRTVSVEQLRCQVAFSRVDFLRAQLAFVGCPELDVPAQFIEKNWAVMSRGDRLFLLYTAEPFHLLELEDWARLRFRTVERAAIRFPFSCPRQSLRNSLNPVDYDEHHWLHVVHRVYPGKQYCFWALLIDKARLRPVFALPRPLARGGQPFPASILYLCSAVAGTNSIRFFFGVNDSGSGTAEVLRSDFDAQWRRLP